MSTKQQISISLDMAPDFQTFILETLRASDQPFSAPIRRHWRRFEEDGVRGRLGEFIHIEQQEFDRDHMIKMLGRQRQALHDVLSDVTDIHSLREACVKFIESEIDTLFFVTNDEHQAQLARDYFDTFMDQIIARTDEKKPENDELISLCIDLKDYYGLHLDAYEAMIDAVSKINQPPESGLQSLVEWSLLSFAKTPEEKEAAHELLSDKEALLDSEKRAYIEKVSRVQYQQLMEKFWGISYNEDEAPDTLDALLRQRINNVAAERHREALANVSSDEEAAAMQETIAQESNAITTELEPIIKLPPPHGIVEAFLHLDTLQTQASGLLIEYPDAIKEMMEVALQEAQEALPALVHRHATRKKVRPLANADVRPHNDSKDNSYIFSLSERLLPGMDVPPNPSKDQLQQHIQQLKGNLKRVVERSRDLLEHTTSLLDLAEAEDKMLETVSASVYFGPLDPTSFLYLKQYFASIRRQMTKYLEDENMDKAQEYNLQALADVEKKCDLMYDGFFPACDWIMDLTNGAHDRAALPAFLNYAFGSGKLYHQLSVNEQREVVYSHGLGTFCESLTKKGINDKRLTYTLTPYIYERCYEIAVIEQLATSPTRNSAEEDQASLPTYRNARGKFTKKLLRQSEAVSSDVSTTADSMSTADRTMQLFTEAMGMFAGNSEGYKSFLPAEVIAVDDFLKQKQVDANRGLARAAAIANFQADGSGDLSRH